MSDTKIPDDVKRQALAAAQGAKDVARAQTLPATNVDRTQAVTPTNTPGYQPAPTQPWNPIQTPNPVPPPAPSPAPAPQKEGPDRG